jgi:ribosome-associated protein
MTDANLQSIAVFGGSFDPVHNGHVMIARSALAELELDRLIVMPAAQSPFKPDQALAPGIARMEMLRAAFSGEPEIEISSWELDRGGVSYSIETLRALAAVILPHWRGSCGDVAAMAGVGRACGGGHLCGSASAGRAGRGLSSAVQRALFTGQTNGDFGERNSGTSAGRAVRGKFSTATGCAIAQLDADLLGELMQGLELAEACRLYAEEKKAEDVIILDVREVSSITDYFVIATGTSEPHVRAIWTEVADSMKQQHGVAVGKPEGVRNNKWVVLDYFDVIVHVMIKDIRDEYDLEGLWNDAPQVTAEPVA